MLSVNFVKFLKAEHFCRLSEPIVNECYTCVSCFVADEVNRKEEILKFLNDNKQQLTNEMKDVQVTTMRHILPMLLMEAYSDHYAPYMRKGD